MEAELNKLTLSQKREYYETLAAIDKPDVKDIIEKMLMARNVVLKHSKSMAPKSRSKATTVSKAMQLTGVNEETVKAAIATARKNMRFFEAANYREILPARDYEFLRDIITDLYVEKRLLPKIKQIIECIQEPNYNISYLLGDLKTLGYLWKRLPGTDASVLIENPEQLFNRINYLKKMIEYRRNDRCLVYVRYTRKNSKTYDFTTGPGAKWFYRAFAASPSLGLLNWTGYPANYPHLEHWFWRICLPLLPKSCVVVMNKNEIVGGVIGKVPTPGSSKAEMIKWLEDEDIPHNPCWHRAELYKLVEAYKRNNEQELRTLEEYSRTSGHEFLIVPESRPALNYYRDITEENMKRIEPQEWFEHDIKLAQRELKIYKDSVKFEKIIDQIFTMATYEDVRGMSKKLEKHSSKDKAQHVCSIILE